MTAALWPSWLGPMPPVDVHLPTVLIEVGGDRPVVRVPDELGRPTLERLLGHAPDRAQLGAVLHHRLSRVSYWWVRPGASTHYPDGCRLLADRTAIPVPAPGSTHCTVARWLHLPDEELLTGPVWLARALQDQEAIAADAARSAAIGTRLDELPWEPGQCDQCPANTGTLVTKGSADLGFEGLICRRHLGLILAMNGHRLHGLDRTEALNGRLDARRRERGAGAPS